MRTTLDIDDELLAWAQQLSALVDAIWSGWAALYTRPALYRAFGWLATRFRALTPPMQSGWTVSRTPLKPAKRTLHERMAGRRRS